MSVTRAERRRQGKSDQGPPRNRLGLWLAIGGSDVGSDERSTETADDVRGFAAKAGARPG